MDNALIWQLFKHKLQGTEESWSQEQGLLTSLILPQGIVCTVSHTCDKQTHSLGEELKVTRGERWGEGQLGSLGWTCTHCCI